MGCRQAGRPVGRCFAAHYNNCGSPVSPIITHAGRYRCRATHLPDQATIAGSGAKQPGAAQPPRQPPALTMSPCCRYVGFGAEGHWESDSADACPNFREDLEAYLSTSGSHYRTLQVGTI